MRNWTKRKRTFWQSLRIKFTAIVFQLAEKIENPKFGFLEDLKLASEHYFRPNDFDLIDYPQNLEVRLSKICFSELFFSEEFAKLQQGLNKLLSSHPSLYGKDDKNRVNEWFDNIQNASSATASMIYVGWLIFDHKKDDSVKLMHSAQIQLLHISSSFIALSISINPSEELIKKFDSTVKNIPHPQNEILGFNFRYGITALNSKPSLYTRKAELEEILLEMNKNVVNLFRKTFDAGLSRFGPLPIVEIISINSSLREIPKNLVLLKASKKMRACCNFLASLGYPSQVGQIYRINDWSRLYEIHRSELFYQKSHSYQVLMSTADYKKIKDVVNLDKEEMFGSISYSFHELLFLFALEHFHELLKNLVLDLKSDLEPVLSSQVEGKIKLKTLKLGISKMAALNGFYFHHSRIWAGIDESSLWDYIGLQAKGLLREKYGESGSDSLLDDMKYRISRNKKFCDEQLSLLRLSYEQLLSYKATTLNWQLQQLTFWLSIAVGFLTVATLLPESTRQNLWTLIWDWLNSRLRSLSLHW